MTETNYAQLATEYEPGANGAGPYRATPEGLVWLKRNGDGETAVRLANFSARIVRDVLADDGYEPRREFELEVSGLGAAQRVRVPAREFAGMGWVLERLGARAQLASGRDTKDRVREAIQQLSPDVAPCTVYAHLGWRQLDGQQWAYLHAGGALGAAGPLAGVAVEVRGELARFQLPEPPSGEELIEALDASLGMLEVGPPQVLFPLYACIWRAVLGATDFTVHVTGPSGAGKSSLAALVQQHWGRELHDRALPSNWQSTANSLAYLGSLAADAVLVTDDFAPGDGGRDAARYYGEFAQVLRGQGNQSGRQRMTRDGTLAPTRASRCLRVSTGEDAPRGQSIMARIVPLELIRGEVDLKRLTVSQRDAADGRYAAALAGFLRWLAPAYSTRQREFRRHARDRRDALLRAGQHGRTTDNRAQLEVALELYLTFVRETGARSAGECDRLLERAHAAFDQVAASQAQQVAQADPVPRYLEELQEALTSGDAHLADKNGDPPADPGAWGWRAVTVGAGMLERTDWRHHGKRIGYLDGEDCYLNPGTAYQVVQDRLRADGDTLGVRERELRRRLAQHGVLASKDRDRETYAVQRTLQGRRQTVLHLRATDMGRLGCAKPEQPEQDNGADG